MLWFQIHVIPCYMLPGLMYSTYQELCAQFWRCCVLTHWGRVTHICVGNLTIIGSDNGLSPGRRQAIIWTNAAILLIGPLGTNFSEILIEIDTYWFKKMWLKVSSAKWRPFCLGLNVLMWFRMGYFSSISFCVTSLVLGQSYNEIPSPSEATPKNM